LGRTRQKNALAGGKRYLRDNEPQGGAGGEAPKRKRNAGAAQEGREKKVTRGEALPTAARQEGKDVAAKDGET